MIDYHIKGVIDNKTSTNIEEFGRVDTLRQLSNVLKRFETFKKVVIEASKTKDKNSAGVLQTDRKRGRG